MKAAALLLPLAFASVVHADAKPEILVVPSVRVKFEVPPGWQAVSNGELLESRQRVKLGDPELNRYIQERARLPKLTFTKHPVDYPAMNPTLQVYTARPGHTAEEIAQATIKQLAPMPGFKIVEPPHAIVIRERKAVLFRATFPLAVAGLGEPIGTEARMIVVVDGAEAAVFGFSGPSSGADRSEKEFQRLLASIAALK